MTVREELATGIAGLPPSQECWALVERVAASPYLKRSARLQGLLFYIAKRYLTDGCERVHEQEIGAQVFKRPDSYDTSLDNIVRTNVSDLRKRIEAYFQTEGQHEPLVVEIPRGGYSPVFRYRGVEAESTANGPAEGAASTIEPAGPVAHRVPAVKRRSWIPVAFGLSALLIVVLATGCIIFWSQLNALRHTLYGWQYKPSVATFWSDILSANSDTDIVMSDTGIGIVQALSQKTFPLNQYLNHSYVEQLQQENYSPDMHAALNRIAAWNLASPDEFSLARRILALDPTGKKVHLYNARNYMPDLIKRDNVILIGARKSNPWDELVDNRLNFITEFDNPRVVNRAPVSGEQAAYQGSDSVGYCVVAYLPKADQSGVDLLIEGTNAESTEAAGDFLLSEDQMAAFMKMMQVSKLPYFQVLLKVSEVRGAPLSTSIEAYRAGPTRR